MFTLGFTKIADNAATGGSSNQGFPFASADTNNSTANVGPGGMTPAGIDSYQPVPNSPEAPKSSKKKLKANEVAQFLMHKGAGVLTRKMDNGTSEDNFTQGAKYDSSTPDATQEDVASSAAASKARRKAFIKASLK